MDIKQEDSLDKSYRKFLILPKNKKQSLLCVVVAEFIAEPCFPFTAVAIVLCKNPKKYLMTDSVKLASFYNN